MDYHQTDCHLLLVHLFPPLCILHPWLHCQEHARSIELKLGGNNILKCNHYASMSLIIYFLSAKSKLCNLKISCLHIMQHFCIKSILSSLATYMWYFFKILSNQKCESKLKIEKNSNCWLFVLDNILPEYLSNKC